MIGLAVIVFQRWFWRTLSPNFYTYLPKFSAFIWRNFVFKIFERSCLLSLYLKNVGEKCTATNYRPVSLLFVARETFEKLVNNSLVHHLEKCGFFSAFQYGSKSSRSTVDLLTVVYDTINRAFNMLGATPSAALNISTAFDRSLLKCFFTTLPQYLLSLIILLIKL